MNRIVTESDIRWNRMLATWVGLIWVVIALSMIGGGLWLVIAGDVVGWLGAGMGVIFGALRVKCGSWGFRVRVDIEELGVHYEADNEKAMEGLIKQRFGSLEKFDEKLEALSG